LNPNRPRWFVASKGHPGESGAKGRESSQTHNLWPHCSILLMTHNELVISHQFRNNGKSGEIHQAWALARRAAGDVAWAPPGTFPPRTAGELLEIIKGKALRPFMNDNGDQSSLLTLPIRAFEKRLREGRK